MGLRGVLFVSCLLGCDFCEQHGGKLYICCMLSVPFAPNKGRTQSKPCQSRQHKFYGKRGVMKSPGHLTGVSALQGTFLVRPGLSLAGCMVISAVVPEGPCKHMALDSNQLSSRSLEVSTALPQLCNQKEAAPTESAPVHCTFGLADASYTQHGTSTQY